MHTHVVAITICLAVLGATVPALAQAAKPRVTADIAFLPEGRTEKLDVYLPADAAADAKLPVVLFIHGGGWAKGDKAEPRALNIASTLVAEGYVVASINYALAGIPNANYLESLSKSFPRNLQDCKSAVRFLRKNAATYHIDPDRIAVMGGSAGAHLAAMVAYTSPADGFEPADDGLGDVSSRVQALIGLYGVYDWTDFGGKDATTDAQKELCVKASPLTYLDKDDPPTYAIHGRRDNIVRYTQTTALEAKLTELAVPHQTVIVVGVSHSFDFKLKLHDMRADVVPFLAKHVKGEAAKAAAAPTPAGG